MIYALNSFIQKEKKMFYTFTAAVRLLDFYISARHITAKIFYTIKPPGYTFFVVIPCEKLNILKYSIGFNTIQWHKSYIAPHLLITKLLFTKLIANHNYQIRTRFLFVYSIRFKCNSIVIVIRLKLGKIKIEPSVLNVQRLMFVSLMNWLYTFIRLDLSVIT